MYKCKEIIELSSQAMDVSLPWYTRLEMKAHFIMCKTCRRYAQHLQFMNKALGTLDAHEAPEKVQLSEGAKQRIAKKIREHKETAE